MAFIRRVRTASGATAVQVAEYSGGRQRIVAHVGSAHTDAELGVPMERARELLADPAQVVLDLGVEPTPQVVPLVGAPSRQGALELAVGCVKDLGQVLGLITLRRSPQLGSR